MPHEVVCSCEKELAGSYEEEVSAKSFAEYSPFFSNKEGKTLENTTLVADLGHIGLLECLKLFRQ